MNDLPARNTSQSGQSGDESICIVTAARLHFGLLDTAPPFGGVGVMVDQPKTEIMFSPHHIFQADDAISSRAIEIAERLCQRIGHENFPDCRIQLIQRPSAHCGLGTGTQTSLAIAEGMCRFLRVELDRETMAVEIAGRGKRSAIGTHGYFDGGLIFEDADSPADLNPIKRRIELPDTWRVLILKPRESTETVSGHVEAAQFASLGSAGSIAKLKLRDLSVEDILPAAQTADFTRFADSVQRYNRASGMLFAEIQGGAYHGPAVTRLIDCLSNLGGQGIGQSSWGPGVFVWFESDKDAASFAARLPNDIQRIAISKPVQRGRTINRGASRAAN